MSKDQKDLGLILAQQAKSEQASDITTQVIGEIKNSLVYQLSFEPFLQASPVAISTIGACFLGSSAFDNATLLYNPPGGWRYLSSTIVRADLEQCGVFGYTAFNQTNTSCAQTQAQPQALSDKINGLNELLLTIPAVKQSYAPLLSSVSSGVKSLLEIFNILDSKFTTWLMYACEFHAACVQLNGNDDEALLSNEICLMAESLRLDTSKSTAADAKKLQDKFGQQFWWNTDLFMTAHQQLPNGWDLMGQQVVHDLTSATTGSFNTTFLASLNVLSPLVVLQPGASIVGDFVKAHQQSDPAVAANPFTDVFLDKAADPSYVEVQRISTFLSLLQSIVSGQQNGSINWEMAKASIDMVVTILDGAQQRFSSVATSDQPSLTMTKIITVTSRVAKGLQAAVRASQYPNKDSPQVMQWRADWVREYAEFNTLLATARSMPGTAASSIPLMGNSPDLTSQAVATTAQGQAVLETCKVKLATTTQALSAAKDNYNKISGTSSPQLNRLVDIQATLGQLTTSNLSTAGTRRILFEQIKLILEMKTQLISLIRFLAALDSTLTAYTTYLVQPFLAAIQNLDDYNNDPNRNRVVGNKTMLDLQRSQLYAANLTICSYLGVIADFFQAWTGFGSENVTPGFDQCSSLAPVARQSDMNAVLGKLKTLSSWSEQSLQRLQGGISTLQGSVSNTVQARIDDFATNIQGISAPASSTVGAIAGGIYATEQAVQTSIAAKAKAGAVSRFGEFPLVVVSSCLLVFLCALRFADTTRVCDAQSGEIWIESG